METKAIKVKEPIPKGLVKLLKFLDGKWTVVDLGVPGKTDEYNRQGFVVEY